jgi:hypothetical protein
MASINPLRCLKAEFKLPMLADGIWELLPVQMERISERSSSSPAASAPVGT